jgi:hypothetical protein
MLEVGSHTVLVFVKLQFLGQWTRWSGIQFIGYTSGKAAQLLVVTEDESAAKTTFWFKLDPAHDVWVEEDVVHVPAICLKSAPGDQARCRG